jgi:hypothetical protein
MLLFHIKLQNAGKPLFQKPSPLILLPVFARRYQTLPFECRI